MSKADGSLIPTIKLTMLNGPLSGQIFNFKPGRKVQIGRVVRGNAVAIKDAGVSSKHLLIEFHLLQGHWMVSDLDSSNGTFLNGHLLDPLKPEQISHGDVIKIGESTSISVEIEVVEEASMVAKGRPPRCRGRNLAGKDKKDVSELEEKNEDFDGCMNNVGKAEAKAEEKAGPVSVSRRRGRNLVGKDKKDVSELEEKHADLDGNMNNVGKAVSKVEEKAGPVSVSSVIHEEVSEVRANPCDSGVEAVVEKEEEIESGSKRVTRGMRKKANLTGDLKQKQELGSQRTTRSMKALDRLEENVGQAIKKTRRGRKGKQNVEAEEETLAENVQLEKELVPTSSDPTLHETKDATADHDKPVMNQTAAETCQPGSAADNNKPVMNETAAETCQPGSASDNNKPVMNETAVDTCQQGASVDPSILEKNVCSGVEGRSMNPASSSGSKHLDLENMTLGELFDHLEVSIPKLITEATDKMIEDMRQKSKMAHQYFLQMMKEKDSANKSNAATTKIT